MKISIIVPVYRVEKYLRRCLDSLINQTYQDLEIILIDDGSPDKSGEICDQYSKKDNRIKVIHKKQNEGLSEAWNTGMKYASSEYIFFLDADDYIANEAIDILHKRATETKADIIIGNFFVVNENNEISLRRSFDKEKLDEEDLKTISRKFNYFFKEKYGRYVWNRLYRRQFITSAHVKFEKNEVIYPEDVLFNLKLYINYPKIELVNQYTYYYFLNANSMTNTFKKNLTERSINCLTSYYEYARELKKEAMTQDLIAYRAFFSMDFSGDNVYNHSKNKFVGIKRELGKYKRSEIVNNSIKHLARGKFIKEISRCDWKIYIRTFAILYSLNLLSILSIMQIIRYFIFPKNELRV